MVELLYIESKSVEIIRELSIERTRHSTTYRKRIYTMFLKEYGNDKARGKTIGVFGRIRSYEKRL